MKKILYKLSAIQEIRDHNLLISQLTTKLKTIYPDLEIIDNVADDLTIKSNDIEYRLTECELLLDLGDRAIGVTFIDMTSHLVGYFNNRNNPNDLLIYAQTDNRLNIPLDATYKTKQGLYVTRWPFISLDAFYELRKTKTEFLDKFIFRGNYRQLRPTIVELTDSKFEKYFTGAEGFNPEPYFHEVINHKIGLSIPGIGEFCYRDIEYMAMGVPMMRFEYVGNFEIPLIPNYHYISIPRPPNVTYVQERTPDEQTAKIYAEIYLNKFLEVKDDVKFLNFIAENARVYYEKYLHTNTRINTLLKLMEI